MRRLWILLTALVLVAGPVTPSDDDDHDGKGGVCIGGAGVVACVPPHGT